MKAISTRYRGPTSARGSRIVADDGDGNKVTISYPYEESNEMDAHAKAALALCQKMGWHGRLYAGAARNGYVFVFEPHKNSHSVYEA